VDLRGFYEGFDMTEVWYARDEDNTKCVLEKVDTDNWHLVMKEGAFSGYPSIALNKDDIVSLFTALGNELGYSNR
jgi:hypothetical protein